MDAALFAKYLTGRYEDQLNYYEYKSAKNQKKYKSFQWLLIILSTLTTILAALPHSEKYYYLQYIVVITAASVTILTAALKTFQYQELWVSYRSTIEQLKPEIYYYQFSAGDYGQDGVDKEKLFVTRVETILSKEHSAWPIFKQTTDKDKAIDVIADLQKQLDDLARNSLNTTKAQNAATTDPADEDTTKTATDTNNDPTETVTDNSKDPATTTQTSSSADDTTTGTASADDTNTDTNTSDDTDNDADDKK